MRTGVSYHVALALKEPRAFIGSCGRHYQEVFQFLAKGQRRSTEGAYVLPFKAAYLRLSTDWKMKRRSCPIRHSASGRRRRVMVTVPGGRTGVGRLRLTDCSSFQ